MAAKHCYRKGFLLLLFNFISTAALDKRFSDFKRCADEECSMLLCRGKAVRDFSGPDCRFLSFKTSETIYVYYKLSGKRADMWAGSVGSNFGYFPKDLLAVNHLYTENEVEIRTEETDFVCFDSGFDKFDNYDIDSLFALSAEKNEVTSDQIQEAKTATKEAPPSEEATSSEIQAEHDESLDDLSASSHVPHDTLTESPSTNAEESNTAATLDGTAEEVVRDRGVEPVLETMSEGSETKDAPTISEEESVPTENEPISISEGAQIPEVETTLGTTFDAVTTDDEITKNVTPYEEEDDEDEKYQPEDVHDSTIVTPLLPFSENTVDTPASDSLKPTESPPTTEEGKPKTEEGNMWTSIGDVMFSVVTGGERTTQDLSSEEDEDDEDQEEEPAAQTPLSFDEAKTNAQAPKPPENIEPTIQDPSQSSSKQDLKETLSHSDNLIFEDEGEVIGSEQVVEELVKPPDEPIHYQKEESVPMVEPVLQDDTLGGSEIKKSDTQTTTEPTENKIKEGKSEESDVKKDDVKIHDSSVVTQQNLDQTVAQQASDMHTSEKDLKKQTVISNVDHKVNIADTSLPDQLHAHLPTVSESNDSPEGLFFEEEEEPATEEAEEEKNNVKEELLEDENALSFSQTDAGKHSPETVQPPEETPEPEYSDSVMRLTLLRDHLTEESLARIQKYVGLKNLFKIEAMFNDLDAELQATRLSESATMQDIENALEAILETSENAILDQIESILDSNSAKHDFDDQSNRNILDEETQILDDFQELAFSLRQKYSRESDSTPVAAGETPDAVPDEEVFNITVDIPHIVEEKIDNASETESVDNLTVTDLHEQPAEMEKEQIILDEVPSQPDISMEEDGGHFNRNKDDQSDFSTSDEMQKVPQDTLESPLDKGFGVEVDQPSSGTMDSMEPVPEIDQDEEKEEEIGLFSTGIVYSGCVLSMMRNKTAEWTTVMISLLPEEWKPGETLFGCPWSAVVITALVGVMTFTLFFWRTVLAVKKREYLVDEKKLVQQIQALKNEKEGALTKISELQKQTEQLKETQKQSKETISGTRKKMQALETKVLEAETLNEEMMEEKRKYAKLLEEERANSHRNESRIEKLEKSNEKLQISRKKIQEALTKTSVLLDEAKIREDARNVQQKCQEKEFTTLKEENKSFKAAIKGWEEKHKELSEQIKVYQKSQKELEDSVVLKDHNVEVLSDLLADLDACDSQKSDTKAVANGEVEPDKKTIIKNRIKQMMDVSRAQTTLSVVEEERDRFMTKLLSEEKTRKTLEEQHQELEHAIATLKSEKSHVENQFKILQQKNEIMVEMYQQKENALQQRLTKEELERRSKENLLSEVGGKALEAEEQVKVLRQRINEMEEQMKKTEEVYKEQIKEQENKTHSNWVNARNAERALNQEKLESSKLREKLAVLTSQLNERRAPLFRPNSGQPAGPRQGDSYGPSPVSGGAPSPPLMIEGPRRPPSAPVGRRIDPYGPRPPSDPHGRYAENKHISGIDMMGPRSSSPANLDGSTQAVDPQINAETQAEASTESPEPVGPGSFLASPIRDSPGPLVSGPPPGHGPHDPMLPGPHIRLPPPGPYRPPRPGPYHLPPGPPPPNVPPPLHGPPLPANGYPGMPPPGPMGGDFGPRPANGHAFLPRPGPGHVMDHRGPLPPHFRPPPPHHFGPMPPAHDMRGPVGPRPPVPPDSRFPGQRDHTGPLMDMPPGVPPHPSLQNSAGAHSGPGQDLRVKQEAPQDSARPATVKP